ncbi:pentapeptide repeat-containing protein [Candidatus Poriferisodalis sp.]|uniref:pentapeptide repeat-containing protein n=1 Tax=Candidatus Poriferisodalis sp. TaxID=3101277 RepID=UPI003C6FB30D
MDADLSNANLPGTNMEGANFNGVNLSDTDLSGSEGEKSITKHPPVGLTQTQLDQACADLDNPPKLDDSSGLVWNPRPCTMNHPGFSRDSGC